MGLERVEPLEPQARLLERIVQVEVVREERGSFFQRVEARRFVVQLVAIELRGAQHQEWTERLRRAAAELDVRADEAQPRVARAELGPLWVELARQLLEILRDAGELLRKREDALHIAQRQLAILEPEVCGARRLEPADGPLLVIAREPPERLFDPHQRLVMADAF